MIAISDRDTRPACGFGAPRAAPDPVPVEAALHLLIEHFEQGVAVTDRSGRALFLNHAAQTLIRRGLLRLQNGCLCSGSPEHGAAIGRLIARCAVGTGCSLRLAGETGTLLIAACAIPGNAVLLRVIDPASAPLPDPSVLQAQFGFTPAEAALATDIMAGHDLAASAARRRVTLHTARAHLRRLFEKTGTRRQAELMRLLLLCPLPVAAAAEANWQPTRFSTQHRSNE
ncbi:helix-turn-helix transcriptional regulator [Methylobacterium sp. J-072]|uniref:helix-turn-helix transcriptional regulator n=1 Tax=Methylobacterium sp. J-072 TaxID=2836651 RepID=UPI001FBAEF0A|nr:helix-turn-helix transcriptional regulator [Methylobacterium sp. J-072]MCJ2092237.1 helix-turn-helix transcriptional regulator [Methylobacterium sp. J-072]